MANAVVLSNVKKEPLLQLWPGFIELQGVTLLAAPSGWGKSSVAYSLGAIMSQGWDLPDGSRPDCGPGKTLYAEFEDKQETVLVHKIEAAGFKPGYALDISEEGLFSLPARIDWLAEQIDAAGDCRLVVINPISTGMDISLNSGVQKIRRQLIMPLERLAKAKKIAILLVGHETKAGKIAGSSALYEAPRTVLRIIKTTTPGIFMLLRAKANNAEDGGGVAFRIVGATPQTGHVKWLDASEYNLAAAKAEPVVKLTDKARIVAVLEAPGAEPMGWKAVFDKCGEPPIKPETVRGTLSRMVKHNEAYQPERGLYAIGIAQDKAA